MNNRDHIKGAYLLSKSKKVKPQLLLFASGSEVTLALDVQEKLKAQKVDAAVISFPSWELFEKQSKAYKESILIKGVKKVAIEMAATQGWHKYVGTDGLIIGIDKFGASGPAGKVQKAYGFDAGKIVNKIKGFLSGK